jgi:hypothetical protein
MTGKKMLVVFRPARQCRVNNKEEASMEQEPKHGLDMRAPVALPVQGRLRPEDVLRRKLIQKMMARRERRITGAAIPARRAG